MSDTHSLAAFGAAVTQMIEKAVHEHARSILMSDPDFECWPLDDALLIEALTRFARLPGRRLGLYARSFDVVRRQHPRFTRWRQTYGHVVDAREPEDLAAEVPSWLVIDRSGAITLRDRELGHFVQHAAGPEVHRLRDTLDALAQRGGPGFAQVVLGL